MPPIAMDVDGDGRVDLVSGTEVWKQNAGGGFDLAWQLATSVHDTAVADLDGDGRAEIVHLRSNGEIADVDLRGIFVYGHDGALKRRIPLQDVLVHPADDRRRRRRRSLRTSCSAPTGPCTRSATTGGRSGRTRFRRTCPTIRYSRPSTPSRPRAPQVANAAPQVYDLDGDGVAEVVFAGYSRIMILDGRTGVREVDPYWTVR